MYIKFCKHMNKKHGNFLTLIYFIYTESNQYEDTMSDIKINQPTYFSSQPRQISTPRPKYQSITAGNWDLPRKSGVTNLYIQNNYNCNYRNWADGAWAGIGYQDQSSGHGFLHKFGNILGDISMGVSVGSGILGTVFDWFGIGKNR